jgi:phospholipid/cholesterol/gamma-HCH transport system substrate-binding protein
MQSNTGAIPALLADPEGKKKVLALLDNLSTAAVSVATVATQLEKGNGAIPLLIHDETFGKELTRNLQNFSRRLDSIGKKLDEGTGTAGKLINDPAIFDAANDVIVGVHESKFLRWLVRDRQKSGIKKRYDEAQANVTPGENSVDGDSAAPPPVTRTPTPAPRTPR